MIVATTHVNADSDALASLVALRLLEGPMTLVLPGSMDQSAQRVWTENAGSLPELTSPRRLLGELRRGRAEHLHVVDTADPSRLGPLAPLVERFDRTLAWDTHPHSADDLPRVALPAAAACVSALTLLLAERGVRPSPEEAGLFLVGIHEDSGHFTFPETTDVDHRAAAACLEWGADPRWPEKFVPRGFTTEQLGLMERMSRHARCVAIGSHSVGILTLELDRYVPELAPLVAELRRAEGWDAAFLLASLEGRLYVIGRSEGAVDVAEVLGPLGGGGRPGAASARLRGVTLAGAAGLLTDALEAAGGRTRTAGELAVRRFVSLPADRSVSDAAETMHAHGINALPLSPAGDEKGGFAGLVSRREVEAAIRHGLADRPVIEISARPPAWVSPGASLAEARAALLSSGGRLVIVGDPASDPVGILTRTTVLLAGSGDPPLAPPRRAPHRRVLLNMSKRALEESWPAIESLAALAGEIGMSLHLVGGCVRDVLLERDVRDVDLVVEGNAPELAREAERRLGGHVHVHELFGTARWIPAKGPPVDLATARTEYYESPASLPRVLHAELRRDLYRRDFTINAMAITLDPDEAGSLRDPYHGYDDLRNGLLRVLHGLSFHDDPTRAFRAARFAARFDFRLTPHTEGLLRSALRSPAFERLGLERLGQELEALLAETEVEQAFRLLRDWRLVQKIHPKLRPGAGFFDQVASCLSARSELRGIWRSAAADEPVPSQSDALWIVVANAVPRADRAALSRLVPGARERRRRWTEGPDRVVSALSRLAGARQRSDVAGGLEGLDRTERVVALGSAATAEVRDAIRWWEREGRSIETALDGRRLMALGVPEGPALGRALRAARREAWNGGDAGAQLSAARRALADEAPGPA